MEPPAVTARHGTPKPAGGAAPKPARGPLRRAASVGGELLVTAGIIMGLFVVWQLWWTDIEANRSQKEALQGLFQDFELPPAGVPAPAPVEPPVMAEPEGEGTTFAVVYVPRFGADYAVPVSSGVGTTVLDTLGLGHYPGTAMPGDVGNFSLAGHRQSHGKALDAIHTLVPGDRIYVQTKDGYYAYAYRNTQIVLPDRVDVLAAVPTEPSMVPTERFLTLTSCNPRFGSQERIIAYAVMESWQPLAAGPPAEIADVVAANAAGGR